MENLKRYNIMFDANDDCVCTMLVKDNGEYVKFSDIKDILKTSNQHLKAKIRVISDCLEVCQYEKLSAEKYDVIKRNLRELSAVE